MAVNHQHSNYNRAHVKRFTPIYTEVMAHQFCWPCKQIVKKDLNPDNSLMNLGEHFDQQVRKNK